MDRPLTATTRPCTLYPAQGCTSFVDRPLTATTRTSRRCASSCAAARTHASFDPTPCTLCCAPCTLHAVRSRPCACADRPLHPVPCTLHPQVRPKQRRPRMGGAQVPATRLRRHDRSRGGHAYTYACICMRMRMRMHMHTHMHMHMHMHMCMQVTASRGSLPCACTCTCTCTCIYVCR